MELKLQEIAQLCGGRLIGRGDRIINEFFTDSRQAKEGAMFVPIKGERVDGHSFIPAVFAKGAASFSDCGQEIPGGDMIIVDDSRMALQTVAMSYRQRFNIPVIGVTGSVGKTTAKEMAALAISAGLDTFRTQGNANSQVGVPLTLLGLLPRHRAAVIEMGMSLPGEMERIARSVRPTAAIFTGVGVSHIEFHGSREKIMEEKLHITDYFGLENTLIVNGDDDLLSTLKGKTGYKLISFGIGPGCDFRAVDIEADSEESRFSCLVGDMSIRVRVPVPGLHNVRNALSSLAAAQIAGVDLNLAAQAIATYSAPNMRGQIKKGKGCIIIDDSYNASPDSAIASLQILAGMEKGPKIALLADMLELGDYSKKGHRDVGIQAKKQGIDKLIAFGPESAEIYRGFDCPENSCHFTQYSEALACLEELVKNGGTVLIKGSRGMGTDRFVKALCENETE